MNFDIHELLRLASLEQPDAHSYQFPSPPALTDEEARTLAAQLYGALFFSRFSPFFPFWEESRSRLEFLAEEVFGLEPGPLSAKLAATVVGLCRAANDRTLRIRTNRGADEAELLERALLSSKFLRPLRRSRSEYLTLDVGTGSTDFPATSFNADSFSWELAFPCTLPVQLSRRGEVTRPFLSEADWLGFIDAVVAFADEAEASG